MKPQLTTRGVIVVFALAAALALAIGLCSPLWNAVDRFYYPDQSTVQR